MKAIVKAFQFIVSKAPWPVVLITLVLFGIFGSLATQAETAQGNEGFSPDNKELLAADRIRDLFGQDSQEGVLQVIVRNEGGDVFTKEAYEAVTAINAALASEALSDNLSSIPGRGASFSYLDPAIARAARDGVSVASDADVKNLYIEAMTGPEANPQFTSLISKDGNVFSAKAQAGLVLVFTNSPAGDDEEGFDRAIENDSEVAEALRAIPTPDGLEVIPFSFNLLFEGAEDGSSEIGRLFGMAALIIFVILGFVYWLKPAGKGALVQSGRRTLADTLLTLFTIFAAIAFMQGIGVLLLRARVIASFNNITQIIPILLIGLGVDYGIHITSRYREEIGRGQDVDGAVRTAIGTVGVALALATVTTAIGFLTNLLSPVPALKDFGLLAAIGIIVSFILTLTFFPAARKLLDRRTEKGGKLSWGLLRVLILARKVDRQLEPKRPLPHSGHEGFLKPPASPCDSQHFGAGGEGPGFCSAGRRGVGRHGSVGIEPVGGEVLVHRLPAQRCPRSPVTANPAGRLWRRLRGIHPSLDRGERTFRLPEVHNALASANMGLAEVENVVIFETPVREDSLGHLSDLGAQLPQ